MVGSVKWMAWGTEKKNTEDNKHQACGGCEVEGHCSSLFHHCSSLFHQCSSLFTIVHHCSSLFIIVPSLLDPCSAAPHERESEIANNHVSWGDEGDAESDLHGVYRQQGSSSTTTRASFCVCGVIICRPKRQLHETAAAVKSQLP